MKRVIKVAKMQIRAERTSWPKGSGKKGCKGQEKGGRGEHVGPGVKTEHIQTWCRKGGDEHLYAIDEDESENIEETLDNDEELQAWCLLEQSENEQWHEVIS